MGWLCSFATDGSDLAKPSWSVDETSATMAWLPSLPFSASETVLGQRDCSQSPQPFSASEESLRIPGGISRFPSNSASFLVYKLINPSLYKKKC